MFRRLEKWVKERRLDKIGYDQLTLIGCINEEIKEGIDKAGENVLVHFLRLISCRTFISMNYCCGVWTSFLTFGCHIHFWSFC